MFVECIKMSERGIINIVGLSVLVVIIVFTYGEVIQWMYGRYISADSYYSHGFIIPFVVLFLVWQKKKLLLCLPQHQSKIGLGLIIFALGLHILGTILYIFSISSFSLFFLIIGLILYLFGMDITKIIWFPLLFLIFMFPVPIAFINLISFPLKIIAAKGGVYLASLVGIPVYREGFNISIPAGHLLVGNPCSGLRSLISFMALGSIFAYLTKLTRARKLILFSLSIPIALLSNLIRVSILILTSHYMGLAAAGPGTLIHNGSGILIFILGLLLMQLSAKVLEWQI